MGEFLRRMLYLVRRRQRLEEMESEMAFHREMAAREGRQNFGNAPRLQEQAREAWGWTWLDRLVQDLKFAARLLWRAPGFTLTAVLVLAIGIGANVTAFSLFNLAMLKPLPVRDPASLVFLERRSPHNIGLTPYASAMFYREHAKTLSALMARMGDHLEFEGNAGRVNANFVTANYFPELGIRPSLGRLLDPARDEVAGAPPVVVISYQFWQQQFAGDAGIVGRIIHLNNKPVTVVGVLPESFGSLGGSYSDVWLPVVERPYLVEGSPVLTETGGGSVTMWARLAPGVSARTAEQELLALTNELRRHYPKDIWDDEYIHSEPAGHMQILTPPLYPVLGMAGALVLLILAVACANLGGLMVARGLAREAEMGIRTAVGASRPRLFRQMFTESLLLAALGTLAGLMLSYVTLRITLVATDAPKWMTADPDWRVLSYALGIGVLAALAFGLTPALQIARRLHKRTRARQVLIAAQVAASCVLLIVAALLVRGVQHALYSDPGFQYEQVLSIDPGLGGHNYTPEAARNYIDQLRMRLLATPGVRSVAMSMMPPLSHDRVSYSQETIHGREVVIYPDFIDQDFFRTMGITLLRGRNLEPGEQHAVVLSEGLARREWPGEDAIGKQYGTDGPDRSTVVGVVRDAHMMAVSDGEAAEVYIAAQLENMPSMALVVKTAGDPERLPAAVKTICASLDPKVLPTIQLLKAGFHQSVLQAEQIAAVASLMGMIAVLLAAVGMVGLVAYAVSQRMKEIAIRMALGAKPGQVLTSLLRQFFWPVAVGTVAGVGMAAAGSQVLRRILFGISNLDPLGYGTAITVLIAIVVVAALVPARRALRVNVARALHYE